ncbi:putative acyl carrier protein [Acetobacter sp. CAG:977]|nr:putative acyl carrier protein [Acetobacter sp. CAG:977]
MKKAEYLAELQDVLQRDDPVCETDVLDDYEEWDSLSKMAVMAFYDKAFGVKLSLTDMKSLHTVKELMDKAEGKIEE